jgi:putative tricarboxylic transport membrane protein
VYYFVFNELGFVVATSVFLLPLMAYFNRGKWIANVASAIGFSALIYWLFVKLDVNLPSGILPF